MNNRRNQGKPNQPRPNQPRQNNHSANKNKPSANVPGNQAANNANKTNVLTDERSGWCMPTIIYVILFSITLIINLFQDPYNNENKNIAFKINLISHHLLYGLIFTIIIYLLCKQGYNNTAWIVLLLPLVLFIVFFVIFMLGFSFRLLGSSGSTRGMMASSSGTGASDQSQ